MVGFGLFGLGVAPPMVLLGGGAATGGVALGCGAPACGTPVPGVVSDE